ncbi:MAG TPA: glycosyltransferase family 1 protein [Vicinamibacteria bacterium]|nr:glycosyltransferase family 1 protein [Vicinamibacteria bacterium]
MGPLGAHDAGLLPDPARLLTLRIGIDARELQGGRPTGTGRYLRNLLRRWREREDLELLVYFNGAAPTDLVLEHPRVTRRALGGGASRGLAWQELRLPRAMKRDRLDVFFAPAYSCPLRLRVPRVTSIHDLSFFSWPDDMSPYEGLRRRLLVAASARVSARLVVDCDFGRRELLARFPDVAGRVAAVPLGPDDDLPAPASREAARRQLGTDGLRVLTVGSIFNRRRLPVLLDAIGRLRRSGVPALLDVVGDNRTAPRLDLPRAVRQAGLSAAVSLLGFVSDDELVMRYAAADAFVFLSEYEGFGLPVLEAMVRGLPVVTSTRPSLGELFAGAALLVDPSDAVAVAAALRRLLTDPREREALVARGRERARQFSWAQTAERTLAVLREAAA